MRLKLIRRLLMATLILLVYAQCAPASLVSRTAGRQHIVLHSWRGNFPQEMLDAFEAEFGVTVENVEYDSAEEGVAHLFAEDAYDVLNLDNRYLPPAIASALLAQIDLRNIENFQNVTPAFRNLAFDPGNKYSVPLNWGATGLLTSLYADQAPALKWADLWDERLCGHIVVWKYQGREMVSLTLKSLGYSANSEDAYELAEASQRLMELSPCVMVVEETEPQKYVTALITGKLRAGIAGAAEARKMTDLGAPLAFHFPSDGALIWGDSLVVPAASMNKLMAERFINFVLRPENSAALINRNYYRIANDAADSLVAPTLRSDPDLFPPTALLRKAEMLLPLSDEGQRHYTAIWEEFLRQSGASS